MHKNKTEKYILRKAFNGLALLPASVLWRRKEAFSDGVSDSTRDTQTIIREYLQQTPQWRENISDDKFQYHLPPQNDETKCYRSLFESHFPGHAEIINYYWMPKWCGDIKDPSARELAHHHKK